VWAVLTGIQNWAAWQPKISKTNFAEPLAAGSRFSWKINGTPIQSQLHTVEPEKTFGWSGTTFGAAAIHNWFLEKNEDGSTTVRVEESMEGWLVALFKNKMNRDLASDMDFWLEALRERCEA
jgi:hypothetical protein